VVSWEINPKIKNFCDLELTQSKTCGYLLAKILRQRRNKTFHGAFVEKWENTRSITENVQKPTIIHDYMDRYSSVSAEVHQFGDFPAADPRAESLAYNTVPCASVTTMLSGCLRRGRRWDTSPPTSGGGGRGSAGGKPFG